MNQFKTALIAAALLAALPLAANAESKFVTGPIATALTADAKLDFKVVIPKILFLQVGTGTNFADLGTVDMITFTVPAANVGDSSPVAGTGGPVANPSGVNVKLVGNNGSITLKATTAGAMTSGVAGETISFAQITSTSNNLAGLPAPVLADGPAAGASVTAPATNKVVNQTAVWTYSYLNTVTPAAGTYGGAGVNNSRVTYTASMP